MVSDSASPAAATAREPRRIPLLALAGVLALTLAVFARGLGGELVYDDLLMVARNPRLGDLRHLPELVTRPYWDFLDAADPIGYWRPLTAITLSLAHAAGGGSAAGLHAAGLLAHLGATAAAFLLARRLLGNTALAALASLLFALHPLHVEAVAWITAVNDPLYGCFALLALHAWCKWRDAGSRGMPIAAAIWFALALLGKETAVVVPLLAWVIDLTRAERPSAATSKAGFGALAAVLVLYFLARTAVFASPWGGLDLRTTGFGVAAGRLALLRVELFGGALELLAWPRALGFFRPFRPEIPPTDPALLRAAAWTIGFLVLGGWLIWKRRRDGTLALAFVAATLAPMLVAPESLGIFPLSDRFLYLAVFGLAFGLVLLARQLAPPPVRALALLVVGVLYGAKSLDRTAVWHDEEALFRDAVASAPRSPYVQWGLGRVLLGKYRDTSDRAYLQEAHDVYVRAQDLLLESRERPTDVFASSRDFLQANLGYGWCVLLEDRAEGWTPHTALEIFEDLKEKILALDYRTQEAQALGIRVRDPNLELEQVYTAIGVAHMQGGSWDDAEAALLKALVQNPRYPEAHLNLGRVYSRMEEWQLARRHFERALAERPTDWETRLLLAQALHGEGKLEEAAVLARGLIEQDEARPEPHVILGAIALAEGDLDEALRQLDAAVSADVTSGQAWNLRAQALLLRGDHDSAVRAFRRAIRLLPDDFEVHYNFGIVLINSGELQAGLPVITRAYELCNDEDLATQLYEALQAMPIDDADLLYRLASIDGAHGRLDRAQEWLRRVFEVDPEHADAWFQRGRLLQAQGRHDEALEAMARACPLESTSFLAHAELGGYLGELERLDQALAHLERARELGPPDTWNPRMRSGAMTELERQIGRIRGKLLEARE